MSRIHVVHRTGYDYDQPVGTSFNEARMTPLSSHEQHLLATRLEIAPQAWQNSFIDYWGTRVVAFEVHEPHQELRLTAVSEVDVDRRISRAHVSSLAWDDLDDPELQDSYTEVLELGQTVAPDESLIPRLTSLREASESPFAYALEVADLVHHEVEYHRGVTSVASTAAEAWAKKGGVCQDLAHVVIGAARWAGVPTRYVSGYMVPVHSPRLGVPVAAESHAWVQFWDGEWIGYDPTNAARPDDRYVEVGYGRDYHDVPPLSGVFSGEAKQRLVVEVELTRQG